MEKSEFDKYLSSVRLRIDDYEIRSKEVEDKLTKILQRMKETNQELNKFTKELRESKSISGADDGCYLRGGVKERMKEIKKMDLKNGISMKRLEKLDKLVNEGLPFVMEAKSSMKTVVSECLPGHQDGGEFSEEFYEQFKTC